MRAHPVVGPNGFVRLGQEPADFIRQVVLRGVELLPSGELQIFFSCTDVVGGVLNRLGLLLRRQLR